MITCDTQAFGETFCIVYFFFLDQLQPFWFNWKALWPQGRKPVVSGCQFKRSLLSRGLLQRLPRSQPRKARKRQKKPEEEAEEELGEEDATVAPSVTEKNIETHQGLLNAMLCSAEEVSKASSR